MQHPLSSLFTLVPTEGIAFSSLFFSLLPLFPISHLEYWKILALLYYPAFYYPLVACATVRHRLSYLLGCLLSWSHCLVHIWQKVDCPQSPKVRVSHGLGEEWGGWCGPGLEVASSPRP